MNPLSNNPAIANLMPSPAPATPAQEAPKVGAGVVEPMVKPTEVVQRKEVAIALDTSGVSSSSVRQYAQPIEKAVQEAAAAIQDFIQSRGVNLNVSVDPVTNYHVIRVSDPRSGEMVMQLPSEEAIRVAHSMESLQGLLFNGHA